MIINSAEDWDRYVESAAASEGIEELVAAYQASKRLTKENPYVADLIRTLWQFPNGRLRRRVIEVMERNRRERGHDIPRTFSETVQRSFNRHAAASETFRKERRPGENPLFSTSGPQGDRMWHVDQHEARGWLALRLKEVGPST